MDDPNKALAYINAIDLSGVPLSMREHAAEDDAGAALDQTKDQAQVVGSGVFSFAQGVDKAARAAISDSALLAQLTANQRCDFEKDPESWFKLYLDVLGHVGWTVQDNGWSDYSASGTGAEVNEQILPVIVAALAPAATAVAIITATVDALKEMDPKSSWFTIFNRETRKASVGRFQIGLVEKGADDDLMVSLVLFLLKADSDLTQVLFFKYRQVNAQFRANPAKVSLDRDSVGKLAPQIRAKVLAFQADYVSGLLNLPT